MSKILTGNTTWHKLLENEIYCYYSHKSLRDIK